MRPVHHHTPRGIVILQPLTPLIVGAVGALGAAATLIWWRDLDWRGVNPRWLLLASVVLASVGAGAVWDRSLRQELCHEQPQSDACYGWRLKR